LGTVTAPRSFIPLLCSQSIDYAGDLVPQSSGWPPYPEMTTTPHATAAGSFLKLPRKREES